MARLPGYLRALTALAEEGIGSVSSEELAAAAGVSSAMLRKDLSHLGSYGVRGVGYDVERLASEIAAALGLTQDWPVAIIGMGNLGRALAAYRGFAERGFRVIALLDHDAHVVGEDVAGTRVRPMSDLPDLVARDGLAIGVIATPPEGAQEACDVLVAAGVRSRAELRARRAHRPRRGRRPQGRPLDRAADPRLPRPAARGRRGGGAVSLVVLGLSHHEAPLALLESVALDGATATALEDAVLRSEHVTEAVVLSTCNRTEVYAEALTFHGALVDITHALAAACGVERAELQPHLYVHYEDRGICHAFTVAAGLDSMAVGEAQILGQVRRTLARAQRHGHVGPALNGLFQQALRVAKRVHAETEIDLVSGSLVQAGLTRAEAVLGGLGDLDVARRRGRRDGCPGGGHRRPGRRRLGRRRQPQRRARAGPWPSAPAAPPDPSPSSTTPSPRPTSSSPPPARAGGSSPPTTSRPPWPRAGGRPQVYVDLALPHDVDLAVADLDGATRVGLAELGDDLAEAGTAPQVAVAGELVTAEVAAYLVTRSAQAVAPTVTALRARAGELVDAELERLERRTPGMGEAERAEVRRAVERVVDKLLHTPTVRVKELARDGQGGSYARALSELFDLDPRDVSLVSAPPTLPGEES